MYVAKNAKYDRRVENCLKKEHIYRSQKFPETQSSIYRNNQHFYHEDLKISQHAVVSLS